MVGGSRKATRDIPMPFNWFRVASSQVGYGTVLSQRVSGSCLESVDDDALSSVNPITPRSKKKQTNKYNVIEVYSLLKPFYSVKNKYNVIEVTVSKIV